MSLVTCHGCGIVCLYQLGLPYSRSVIRSQVCAMSLLQLVEGRVTVTHGRSPNLCVVQEPSQFGIICMVEVCPGRQLAPVGRGGVDELPLLHPAAHVFQHVDTFGSTPSQSPGKQGFKHRRAILQGLIVDQLYSCKAGPWMD